MTNFPLPDQGVYEAVLRFYNKLDGVRDVLTDPLTTSVRLVVNPERMVIAEAKRTFTYLNLFGYRVDAVVVNRLLPDEVSDPYFDRWKQIQSEHMREIRDAFGPLPLLTSSLRDGEPVGSRLLEVMGNSLYGDYDAAGVLHADDPMVVARRGDDYVLSLSLPFARRDELVLSRKEGELFVRVGPYRRTIMLPRTLCTREVASATLEGQRVEVVFERGSSHDGRGQGSAVQRSVRYRS
jgi:arsenite-transporting ATPase